MFMLGASANLFPSPSDISGSSAITIHAYYAANQAVRGNERPGFFCKHFCFAEAEELFSSHEF